MIVKIPTEWNDRREPVTYRIVAHTYAELAGMVGGLPESEILATRRYLPFRVAAASAVAQWENAVGIHVANFPMLLHLCRVAERHPMFTPKPATVAPPAEELPDALRPE